MCAHASVYFVRIRVYLASVSVYLSVSMCVESTVECHVHMHRAAYIYLFFSEATHQNNLQKYG